MRFLLGSLWCAFVRFVFIFLFSSCECAGFYLCGCLFLLFFLFLFFWGVFGLLLGCFLFVCFLLFVFFGGGVFWGFFGGRGVLRAVCFLGFVCILLCYLFAFCYKNLCILQSVYDGMQGADIYYINHSIILLIT